VVGTFIVPVLGFSTYCTPWLVDIGDVTVHLKLPAAIPVKVMELVVEDFIWLLKVTVHDVPDGRPLSVKVIVYLVTFAKLAVIVPGACIVAVVEAELELPNVIELVLLDQLLKL
jgi:hypothetical protein